MTTTRQPAQSVGRQTGLTYVEVMVATAIIAVALIPAIQALQTGMLGNEVYRSATADQYSVLSKMEAVLAEPHSALILAASVAGDATTPSSYSDPLATPVRTLVFLSLYDPEDEDGDKNRFTVIDPNLDGDNDPFTGYTGLVWVRVEVEGAVAYLESLSAP